MHSGGKLWQADARRFEIPATESEEVIVQLLVLLYTSQLHFTNNNLLALNRFPLDKPRRQKRKRRHAQRNIKDIINPLVIRL